MWCKIWDNCCNYVWYLYIGVTRDTPDLYSLYFLVTAVLIMCYSLLNILIGTYDIGWWLYISYGESKLEHDSYYNAIKNLQVFVNTYISVNNIPALISLYSYPKIQLNKL